MHDSLLDHSDIEQLVEEEPDDLVSEYASVENIPICPAVQLHHVVSLQVNEQLFYCQPAQLSNMELTC